VRKRTQRGGQRTDFALDRDAQSTRSSKDPACTGPFPQPGWTFVPSKPDYGRKTGRGSAGAIRRISQADALEPVSDWRGAGFSLMPPSG